jgi:hypothetical protein
MSRITTYPIISTVAQDDLLVISDVSSPTFPTKSVTVQQLVGGSTAPLSLTVNGTSGAATLINNVLNIPQYSGNVTQIIAGTNVTISPSSGIGAVTINSSEAVASITTNGTEGEATLTNSVLNIPNYNKNILVFGFAVNASGTPAITIVRNTTGATFTIAADGAVVGAYNITASSAIFGSNSAGAPFTHITCQDPNIASPGQGAGSLPRQTVSRITSTTVLRIEIFKGNTGSLLGDRVAPTDSDLPVTFEATIYPNTVPTPYDGCVTLVSTSAQLSSSIIGPTVSNPLGRQLFMKADGLSFYVQRYGDRTVSQASLATANDPTSTISYVNVSPVLTSIPIYKFVGLRFSSDGSKMFVGDQSLNNFKIHRFILSTPWDITTASSTSDQTVSFTNGGGDGNQSSTFVFNSDGTKIFGYVSKGSNMPTPARSSVKIVLTTPYDLSTAGTPVNTDIDSLFTQPGMYPGIGASGSAFFPNAVGGDDYILLGTRLSVNVFANDVTVSDFVSNNGTSGCSLSIDWGWNSSDKRYLFAFGISGGASPNTIYKLEKYTTGL